MDKGEGHGQGGGAWPKGRRIDQGGALTRGGAYID